MNSLRKKDQPVEVIEEVKKVVTKPTCVYSLDQLAYEFALANPDDEISIWDPVEKKVRPIKKIVFNSDLGVYILYPDQSQEFIPASVRVKEKAHATEKSPDIE